MVEAAGFQRTFGKAEMKSWSIGVMERWSDGFKPQCSNTPSLQHSGECL
jgi:hypothetical protein